MREQRTLQQAGCTESAFLHFAWLKESDQAERGLWDQRRESLENDEQIIAEQKIKTQGAASL